MDKENRITYMRKWRKEHPDYHKKYSRKYFEKNKERLYKYRKKWELINREFISNFKKGKSCLKCGYNKHPLLLIFHHYKGNKSFSIGDKGCSCCLETLNKEIKKCKLICPNCHAEEHPILKNTIRSHMTKRTE